MKLSNMQELARVTSEHNATLRKLEANHTKQIATLKLEHADALLKQKEDLEALHAGNCISIHTYIQFNIYLIWCVYRTNVLHETSCSRICSRS